MLARWVEVALCLQCNIAHFIYLTDGKLSGTRAFHGVMWFSFTSRATIAIIFLSFPLPGRPRFFSPTHFCNLKTPQKKWRRRRGQSRLKTVSMGASNRMNVGNGGWQQTRMDTGGLLRLVLSFFFFFTFGMSLFVFLFLFAACCSDRFVFTLYNGTF